MHIISIIIHIPYIYIFPMHVYEWTMAGRPWLHGISQHTSVQVLICDSYSIWSQHFKSIGHSFANHFSSRCCVIHRLEPSFCCRSKMREPTQVVARECDSTQVELAKFQRINYLCPINLSKTWTAQVLMQFPQICWSGHHCMSRPNSKRT